MSGFLDNIDRLQKALQDLQPLKPEDQERLDKKFRLEFNYNSNHIEGNTLTYGETKLLLLFDDVKGNHTLREYEEMKSHDVAYKLIEEWAADAERPLSENKIKELNQILLVRPYWKEAITEDGQPTRREIKVGDYKQYSNSVRLENGEMFHYASPVDTPIKMQELIDWYRTEEGKMHPVELAAMLHYKFVSIHPFDDGNGRISRLLVNYVLIKNGLPPVVIKSSDKANYLRALHLADVGYIDAFVKYIGEQVIWSLEISIAAGKGEDIEEKNDWEKELDLLKKDLQRSDNLLETKASPSIILDVIENNFFTLCQQLELRCATFKELFFEITKNINYQVYDTPARLLLGTSESNWDALKTNWSRISRFNNVDIIDINFTLTLKGFKKNISAYTFDISVDFHFYPFNYIIINDRDSNSSLSKPYGKKLDEDELEEIVAINMKKLIERIRNVTVNK